MGEAWNVPFPLPAHTETAGSATSSFPSPLKSASETLGEPEKTVLQTPELRTNTFLNTWKVPSPFPTSKSSVYEQLFDRLPYPTFTNRSSLPSPLKSPGVIPLGAARRLTES